MIKTLMICSACPKDGRTSVSTNTSSVIAQTGKSILLIDCDLRKSCVHRHFNVTNNKLGLVDVVLQGRKAKEVSIRIEESFNVLTAGKDNFSPSDLLPL